MSQAFSYGTVALVIGVAACAPLQSSRSVAGNPAACVSDDIYIHQTRPQDLGTGVIVQQTGLSDQGMGGTWSDFYDCRRGQGMTIWLGRTNLNDPSRNMDQREQFNILIQQLSQIPTVSLEAVSAAAHGLDMEVRPIEERRTPCGCEAFYPELIAAQPRNIGRAAA